ncbi:MAG TPA: hypothetical protein PKE32_01845 [Miltoncostaeaceae bacterium]|nr:hypothetical protein [Miltoncostaeaceae bacterium]
MSHVPAIQNAGMHEVSRIAQALMQREAAMAVLASAGERIDRARAQELPPATRTERVEDAPDERRGEHHSRRDGRRGAGGSDEDAPDGPRHVDLTA